MTLKPDGRRLSEHRLGQDALQAVVVVEDIVRRLVVASQVGTAHLPACPLLSEQALNQQHRPRRRSVPVLVGVAVQEVEQLVHRLVACHSQPLHEARTGCAVDGEDVDVDAAHIVAVLPLDERRTAVDDFAEATRIVGRDVDARRLERTGQPLAGVLHEAVVVGPRHTNVHVVVPRNETAVAHGPQHRARPAVVAQAVFAAHTVHPQQYLQDVAVQFVNVVCSHKNRIVTFYNNLSAKLRQNL